MIPVIKLPDGAYACGPEEDREPEVGELYAEMDEYSKSFLSILNGPISKTGIVLARFDTSEFPGKPVTTPQCGWIEACGKVYLDTLGVNAFEAWEAKEKKWNEAVEAIKFYGKQKVFRAPGDPEPKCYEELTKEIEEAAHENVMCGYTAKEVLQMHMGVPPSMEDIREAEHKRREERVGHPVEMRTHNPNTLKRPDPKAMRELAEWHTKEQEKDMMGVGRLIDITSKDVKGIIGWFLRTSYEAVRVTLTQTYHTTIMNVGHSVMLRGKDKDGEWQSPRRLGSFVGMGRIVEMKELEGEYFIGDIGTGKGVLKVEPLKTPERKLRAVWTVGYNDRHGRRVIERDGKRVCPRCEGPLFKTIPLLTGFSDVCPECDK